MGGGSCFLDNLRRQPVVVGFQKIGKLIVAIFIVPTHTRRQFVKVHVLAQMPAVVGIEHDSGGVCFSDFLQTVPIKGLYRVVRLQIEIVGVP